MLLLALKCRKRASDRTYEKLIVKVAKSRYGRIYRRKKETLLCNILGFLQKILCPHSVKTSWAFINRLSRDIHSDRNPGEEQPFFRPDGLLAVKHIKWWMPMITDGWHKLAEKQPEEGQRALTMSPHGKVADAIWKRLFTISEPRFEPFVWEVVYWIEMPALPPDVVFKY